MPMLARKKNIHHSIDLEIDHRCGQDSWNWYTEAHKLWQNRAPGIKCWRKGLSLVVTTGWHLGFKADTFHVQSENFTPSRKSFTHRRKKSHDKYEVCILSPTYLNSSWFVVSWYLTLGSSAEKNYGIILEFFLTSISIPKTFVIPKIALKGIVTQFGTNIFNFRGL